MAEILGFRVSTYARNIMWGTYRLVARDGFGGVADGYYVPVETYIAQHYSIEKIDLAWSNNFLSLQEHDEILALMATVPKLNTIE